MPLADASDPGMAVRLDHTTVIDSLRNSHAPLPQAAMYVNPLYSTTWIQCFTVVEVVGSAAKSALNVMRDMLSRR